MVDQAQRLGLLGDLHGCWEQARAALRATGWCDDAGAPRVPPGATLVLRTLATNSAGTTIGPSVPLVMPAA